MNYPQYFSTLSVFTLQALLNDKTSAIDIVKASMGNISLDRSSSSGSALVAEIPGQGQVPWQDWLLWLRNNQCRSLHCFSRDGALGLFSGQIKLAWLYSEDRRSPVRISGRQFMDFIALQLDPAVFRATVTAVVTAYSQSNFGQPVPEHALSAFFDSAEGPLFLEYSGESLWYEIRNSYTLPERKVVIPPDYQRLIQEYNDAGSPGLKICSFLQNANPQSVYAFRLTSLPDSNSQNSPKIPEAQSVLVAALQAAVTLADKVESPFAEAFTTALSLLELSGQDLALAELVQQCRTTDEGRAIVGRQSAVLQLFAELDAHPAVLGKLLACETADVFGGMGSWNDQNIPPDLSEEFTQVSKRLYSALQLMRTVILRT